MENTTSTTKQARHLDQDDVINVDFRRYRLGRCRIVNVEPPLRMSQRPEVLLVLERLDAPEGEARFRHMTVAADIEFQVA